MFAFETAPAPKVTQVEQKEIVDIHYEKIKDWLINRNYLTANWHDSLKTIRSLRKQACEDLPENSEIKEIIDSGDLDYFKCQKILNILDKVEVKTTSFLGFGGNKRLKTWNYIMKLYETENVFMAEISSSLVNITNFEIPSRRADLVKYVKQLEDLSKKEQDWARTSKEYKKKFEAQCSELHIKGVDISKEIQELTTELVDWYKKFEVELKKDGLLKAVQYYLTYVQFVHGNTKECIPTLQYLTKNGNTTHFEWRSHFGLPIPKVDEGKLDKFGTNQEVVTNEIDWSTLSQVEPVSEIMEITWEVEPVEIESSGGFSMDMIDVVESSSVQVESQDDDVAKVFKWKNQSVLENDESRFQFINDVYELESFFATKISSKQDAQNVLMYLKNVPTEILGENKQDLNKMLSNVKFLVEIINDDKFKQLLMIKSSKKYSDRLVASLKQNLDLVDKMSRNIVTSMDKKKTLEKAIEAMKPGIKDLIDKVKFEQTFLQDVMSKLLVTRNANIFGDINKL